MARVADAGPCGRTGGALADFAHDAREWPDCGSTGPRRAGCRIVSAAWRARLMVG